jgi:anti-sigma-K factor RskA
MSTANDDRDSQFEQHARALLDESVTRVSGSVRSRLNQARHAALAEIETRRRSFWRMPSIMAPAGGVAAAAVIAVLFMYRGGEHGLAASVASQAGYEDIELLSDKDGLDLMENWDGSFYEWAASQDEEGDGGASG